MKSIHILLIEDNEGDIILTREALEQANKSNTIAIARDGKEALDYLNKTGAFINSVSPGLILLDVNLPKKNGIEVLRYIKAEEGLKHIPVIIFTTSSSEKDISDCYNSHANCFITKPVEATDFTEAIAQIEHYWNGFVRLPV